VSQTLEQNRAAYALSAINGFRGDEEEKYSTLIKRLPAMVINNGLGQALAYLLADDENKQEKPSWHLYKCLETWIIKEQKIYSDGDLIKLLMRGDRNKYMHAQAETLNLLTWMTKFADAYLSKLGGR